MSEIPEASGSPVPGPPPGPEAVAVAPVLEAAVDRPAEPAPPAPPPESLWDTCRHLIEAYPARPSDPGHADELNRLRGSLSVQAERLVAELVPGAPWRVDASLGRAGWAIRPWVAFLDPRQTTSTRQGAFVVVDLLWQRENPGLRLGLAVAVGDDHATRSAGLLRDLAAGGELQALSQRGFALSPTGAEVETHQGRLARILAGGLVLHKTHSLLEPTTTGPALEEDLRALLLAYRSWVEAHGHDPLPPDPDRPMRDLIEAVDALVAAGRRRKLLYPRELVAALLLSWRVSPVTILYGPPGSGKTSLVRLLADVGARVHTLSQLGPESLRERVAAAAADPRHAHVLLLEDPPRRATERALLEWLQEHEAGPRQGGLLVAWTRAWGGRPPAARLLDRINVLRLAPPPAQELAGQPPPPPMEPPGVLERELLQPAPGGWRGVLTAHDGPVSAGLVHLQGLLRETQSVLERYAPLRRLSWRAADGFLEYALLAVACELTAVGPGAADQQLRQRLLPSLLREPGGVDPELAQALIEVWSPVTGAGPESACALLRACTSERRSFWS